MRYDPIYLTVGLILAVILLVVLLRLLGVAF